MRILKKALIFIILLLSVIFVYYFAKVYSLNKNYEKTYNNDKEISLRKFPYPYIAALSICSDIDNTQSIEEFLSIQEFLNTKNMTKHGEGIGLEIGNSFLMYESKDSTISYFNGDDELRDIIKKVADAKILDVIHSYGKKSDFKRLDAIISLNELEKKNIKVDVWVDHTISSDNMGNDVTVGKGDIVGQKEYHADLTFNYGIKFGWLGRVTMINGQSTPISLDTFLSIYDENHKLNSIINISKEFAKNILAEFGNKKYALHRNNDLIEIATLDDGQKIYEFMRFDNNWKQVGAGANAKGLAYALSKRNIERLKDVQGYMIIYTHFGKNKEEHEFFPSETINSLRNLEQEVINKNIYVTTTSKLLNYYVNRRYLDWSYKKNKNGYKIIIKKIKDPVFGEFIPNTQDLQGITFYYSGNNKVEIYIKEKKINNLQYNESDKSGRKSVTIPLTVIKYPIIQN